MDQQTLDLMVELDKSGVTRTQIAKQVGLSTSIVSRHLLRAGRRKRFRQPPFICSLCNQEVLYGGSNGLCGRCYRNLKKRSRTAEQRAKDNAAERIRLNSPEGRARRYAWMQKHNYDITAEERELLLNHQSGVCAICGDDPANTVYQKLHTDHCHSCRRVRGLLCQACNILISRAEDNVLILREAIRYLHNNRLGNPLLYSDTPQGVK